MDVTLNLVCDMLTLTRKRAEEDLIQIFNLEWSSVINPHIVKYFTANKIILFFLQWLLEANIPLSLPHTDVAFSFLWIKAIYMQNTSM